MPKAPDFLDMKSQYIAFKEAIKLQQYDFFHKVEIVKMGDMEIEKHTGAFAPRHLQKPAHVWIKSFLQGVTNDKGELLFDALAWFALKVVSVVTSASPCEHSWAIEGWIHSKRRNRLGQQLAQMLTRGHTNMRLKDALAEEQDVLPWDIELVIDEPCEHTIQE